MPSKGVGYNTPWLQQYLGYCQRFRFNVISIFFFFYFILYLFVKYLTSSFLFSANVCPCITDEHEAFIHQVLEIPFEERKCRDLITLDTLHAYCGVPEPMPATRRLNSYSHRHKFFPHYLFLSVVSLQSLCLTPAIFPLQKWRQPE